MTDPMTITPEDAEAMVALALEQAAAVANDRWANHLTTAAQLYELDDAEARQDSSTRSHKASEAGNIAIEIRALRPDAFAALARLREAERAEHARQMGNMKALVRVNLMRHLGKTHEEIDALIDAAILAGKGE